MAHWLTDCSNALGGGNNQTINNPSCDHRNSQNNMFPSLWLNINSFMCWRPGYLAAEKTPHQYYVIFQMWVRGLSAKVQKTKSVAYHPTGQPLAARLFEALSGWCPNSRGLGDRAVALATKIFQMAKGAESSAAGVHQGSMWSRAHFRAKEKIEPTRQQ